MTCLKVVQLENKPITSFCKVKKPLNFFLFFVRRNFKKDVRENLFMLEFTSGVPKISLLQIKSQS